MQKEILKRRLKAVAVVLHNGEQKAAGILLILTVLLALLYVYFLGSAVLNAVVRKEVQHNTAQANSHLAELEVDYLQRKNGITKTLAREMGFSSVGEKEYVERARYLGRADTR